MRKRPFIAARIEKQLNRRIGATARQLGWKDTIVAYTGYGSETRLRVLARVILSRYGTTNIQTLRQDVWATRRGWRNFLSLPAVNRVVQVSVNGHTTDAITDREGYVDISVTHHGLSPGWHHVRITTGNSEPVQAPVLIIGDKVRFGIISDIDDTIITSFLPRLMIAAYNAFVSTESARAPVAGMSTMYNTILRRYPGAPLIYISTGSWSTQPFLERFIGRHSYPAGPMLLTDWGPTNTGWFRSGPAHKRQSMTWLARDFPQIRWLLIGDDGQHDPRLYAEFARNYPNNVAGIAIRELPSMEQVLAHGTLSEMSAPDSRQVLVPEVRAPDGYLLLPMVLSMLDALNLD